MERAYAEFLEQYPEYRSTSVLDALRTSEYGQLDRQQHVYLDYTGGALYAESQVRQHAEVLGRHVFGNPHSSRLSSAATTRLVEQTRRSVLGYRRVEELATLQRISLRTGCFCNPGAGEMAEGLTESDMLAGLEAGMDMRLPRFLQVIQHRRGKSAGAIRASLGLVSNFSDVDRFLQFASDLRDQTRLTIGEVTFDIESCRVIRDGS